MAGPESFHPSSQANIYPGSTTYEKGAPQWEQFHRIREHAAVMEAIEPQVGKVLFAPDSRYLKDPRESWQPTDHLPDWSDPEAAQQWVAEFQQEVAAVPDEAWEVNIGAEITERVIANYPQQIVRLQGMHYTSGADIWKPSIFWVNGWTAQEENHGKVMGGLHAYSGRVDARAVDISVQSLYRNGFDPELEHDPYMGIFYTGRQERGTKTPHGRQGLIFKKVGAEKMARAQGDITGDEASHEAFYTMWGGLIFKEDPAGALIAYNRLMEKNAIMPMPGARMTHGELLDPTQKTSPEFDHFATVAHVIGAYTAADYVADSRHFEKEWNIGHLSVSGEAARAQEKIMTRTERQEKNLPRIMEWRAKRTPNQPSPWLYDRSVSMEEGAKINQEYLARTRR